MQEQKIDSTLYLVLQNSYTDIQIALYNKENLIGKKSIDKVDASRELIIKIDSLLKENNVKLEDLTFLAVNQGPGPFTTLRVIIVTANALNFGGNLPLIAIDGLDAFMNEYKDNEYAVNIVLLNAFNNDVYFMIQNDNHTFKGWQNIQILLEQIKKDFPNQTIKLMGNAVDIFKENILNIFDKNAVISMPNSQTCSIEQIAQIAYENWKNKTNIHEQVIPIYLKDAVKK